jgi:hypothetical protein
MTMEMQQQLSFSPAVPSPRSGVDAQAVDSMARRGNRRTVGDAAGADVPLQGFAFTLRSEYCVAIEDAVGCRALVLAGQAWITAEGSPKDIVVAVGETVPLELGVRFNISAFHDFATVLITAPGHLFDVGFSLQRRHGMRVLTVTSGLSQLPAALSGTPAAIAAFARRCFAATQTVTIQKGCAS